MSRLVLLEGSAAHHACPPPGSLLELEEGFGNPFTDPHFEERHITRFPLTLASGRTVTVACHTAIAPALSRLFSTLKMSGHLGLVKTCDGCFNIRRVRGGNRPSLHAWGLAIDLNAGEFPLGSHALQNPALVRAFTAEGFFNGSRFHRPDPMHFQYTANAM